MVNTIERRLELWEISLKPLTDGGDCPPMTDIFGRIQTLPFQAEASQGMPPEEVREVRVENDILVADCAMIDPDHILGVYGRGKEVDIPALRRGRRKKRLPLGPGEYIEYPSHFVVFDGGLVVFERNPMGPSPTSLGGYIQTKCQDLVRSARVDRVPRGEFLERFKKINTVRSVIIRLGVRAIREFARSSRDGLWSGLEKEYELGGFETVTIRLSIGRGPTGMRPHWFRLIPGIVANPETSTDIHRLEINARMEDSGDAEVLRLIKGASMEKTIRFKVSGENKNLDPEQVYAAIHSLYFRFRRILEGREDAEYLDTIQEELNPE